MKKIAKSLTDLIGNTPLSWNSPIYNKKHESTRILSRSTEYFNPARREV